MAQNIEGEKREPRGNLNEKNLLAQELTAQRDVVLSFCDALSDAQRTAPITPEGWNVQDNLGHLAYWESVTLEHLSQILKAGRPHPPPPDANETNINARERAKRQTWEWKRIRAEFENTRAALIERVNGLSESTLQFFTPSPWSINGPIVTVETLVRNDVLEHGREHLEAFQKAYDYH